MKLRYEAELPDNADAKTILDAMAYAAVNENGWRKIFSREYYQKDTDLTNKCGSCKHFKPYEGKYKLRGDCMAGRVGFRRRTEPKCKAYERKKGRPKND